MNKETITTFHVSDTINLDSTKPYFIDNLDGSFGGAAIRTISIPQDMMGGINLSDKIVAEAPYNPGYEGVSAKDLVGESQVKGRKYDGGKLEYGLLPPLALEETVKVLTFGAQKYERDNWQRVPDSKRRYFDALQRHIWAWKQGEKIDQESDIHHLAHAMCCLMFLYEHDVKYSKYDGEDIAKVMVDEYNRKSKLHNGEGK